MRLFLITAALLVSAATQAQAQGFQAQVSPPRFEAGAKPGTVYREVIEISNPGQTPMRLTVSTADWVLDEQGTAQFSAALAPGSCRPWTAIEATRIEVPANGRKRFRFEVRVPADAESGQCRFGLMFEGEPTQLEGMAMPVAGRIGVIVYLDIGDARADLRIIGSKVVDAGGQWLPALYVENAGNTHGRLGGLVDATDAAGRRWTLGPSTVPILPGGRRDVTLIPMLAEGESADIRYPLHIRGRLEWRDQRIDVDAHVDR